MRRQNYPAIVMALLISLPGAAFGMSVEELKDLLNRKQAVTLVDIRRNVEYSEGHIPGAINIPARLCAKNHLPPVGRVVAYGDGIDTEDTRAALDALKQKPGISAEMLEGGFPAWEELNLPNTAAPGFSREKFRYLDYGDLVKAAQANPDLVLVDLRTKEAASADATAAGKPGAKKKAKPAGGSSDLSASFADARHVDGRRERGHAGKQQPGLGKVMAEHRARKHQLYVLIDDGDGLSEDVARQLRAAGVRRVAILSGGEKALERSGKPGLRTISR